MADQPTPPSVSLEGARVVLGGRAVLDGVDLEVGPSERVALIGPSGAGKTTLLRLVAGILPPTSGAVSVLGADPASLSGAAKRAHQSRVGLVHQDLALVPGLRAIQNVAAGRLGRCGLFRGLRDVLWPSASTTERIHALLERVGVGDHLYQRVDRLSGGEQQRVAVARALHQEPGLLLADEPVSSVDPGRARALVELFVELSEERRLPLVVSLHDLDLAAGYFPRVVGLRDGRVIFDGAPEEARERAAELFRTEGGP
ncbi:MAG: ATP-binding cassette domain-containing protein [Planctomycetota bacterium]|nr:ATP-binding cassette domain-containing protein [Planctomycetota bacterium]